MDNMKQLNAATEKAVYVKPTMQMYEIEIEVIDIFIET